VKRNTVLTVCLLGLALLPGCYAWPYNTRPHTYDAALGDLDGDGDLDAYLANGENEGAVADTVWLNDGSGAFDTVLLQPLEVETHHVVLGDLDDDGDLDAVIDATGAGVVALNDGTGHFSYHRWGLHVDESGAYTFAPALGDLDGDGDLDALMGGCCGARRGTSGQERILHSFNVVRLNDGSGHYRDTGQRLGVYGTEAVALGDLDGDGDLDAVDANSSSVVGSDESERKQPNVVWLNDGAGGFTDSGQRLGQEESHAVALGDLDGDGDLDAYLGNRGADTVWLNDGAGHLADSGQALGDADTRWVTLGDVDGDGDLDALSTGRGFAEFWINLGTGIMERGPRVSHSIWFASALGDVDGDGDPDLFAGLLDREVRVWLNDGRGRFREKR